MPEAVAVKKEAVAATQSPSKAHSAQERRHLELDMAIGFSGQAMNSYFQHPDGKHVVYPIGSTVVVKDPSDPKSQVFLNGHTNVITCIAVSPSGRYLASGQLTHMGYKAEIILWDFHAKKALKHLSLHQGRVESLAFSPNDKYLVSLGGQDDNSIIVWDIQQGVAVGGANASKDSSGLTTCVAYFNHSDDKFVTAGHQVMRVWEFDPVQKKLKAADCQTGQLKRIIKCITVDADDQFMYCGTTTGDLLQVNLPNRLFKFAGPPKPKENFSMSILSVVISPKRDQIIVGCGDGTVAALKASDLSIIKKCTVNGGVTSLFFKDAHNVQVGTTFSNMYAVDTRVMEPTLTSTCHYSKVNDVCFPDGCSDLFATASDNDVRLWNAHNQQELLRINIPNLNCLSLVFRKDGGALLTGWSDGKIRAFGPESGRLLFTINDANKGGVTALAVTSSLNSHGDYRIISGGVDGQVRVWKITKLSQQLEHALKEHRETITCIKVRQNNRECVSAGVDGSCIIWDVERAVRNQIMFAPTFFKAVCYFPEESQLLTVGTDRKASYWEAFDGSLIREIEVSHSDAINGLDITQDGKFFVCGGSDKMVKVFRYEEGTLAYVGVGHSTDVNKIKISPDHKKIVSVSSEGAVFVWNFSEPVGAPLLPPKVV